MGIFTLPRIIFGHVYRAQKVIFSIYGQFSHAQNMFFSKKENFLYFKLKYPTSSWLTFQFTINNAMVFRKRYPARRSVRRRAPVYAPRRTYSKRRAPARRTRKGTTSKCVCPAELTPSTKFLMAQIDPFDAQCQGAKIPDSNNMPSVANTSVELVPMSTGATASNLIATAFRPSFRNASVVMTTGSPLVNPAAFGGGVNRQNSAAYNAAVEVTRTVAHAIRLSSSLAPTTASGFVHIGLSVESIFNTTTWQFPTTVAQMSGLQYYKRVTLASLTQAPITIINKWIDDTGFRYSHPESDLTTAATNTTFQTDGGWSAIYVLVEGAPINSTVLSAEHILLTEFLPDKNGVLIGTSAASNSPEVLAAAGELSTRVEPFHTEAEQEGYIQRGVNAVAQGAALHGEAVFQQVAVPLLQRVGGYGASVAMNMAAAAMLGTGGIGGVNNNPNRLTL